MAGVGEGAGGRGLKLLIKYWTRERSAEEFTKQALEQCRPASGNATRSTASCLETNRAQKCVLL